MAKVKFSIGSKGLKMASAIAGAVLAMGVSANSYGALLVDFKPQPSPANQFEVQYGGTPAQLITIDGAIGNGSVPTAPGLAIETPFLLNLPAAYAESVSQNLSAGTTTFQDVTLVFTNLAANGAAKLTSIAPGVDLVTQLLQTGTFELQSFDPAGPDGKITLLKGSIENAVISGLYGQSSGGVFSAKVNYESGLIKDALAAAGGSLSGDLSWSLLQITAPLATHGTPLVLNEFRASLMGQFGTPSIGDPTIPEPASLSVLGLVGAGLLARRRAR